MPNEELHIDLRKGNKELDTLIDKLKKAGKEAGLTEEEINKIGNSTEKAGKKGGKGIDNISKGMGNMQGIAVKAGAAMVAAFAVEKLVEFGKFLLDTERKVGGLRKQIQRFSKLSGESLDNATANVQALATTFDKDLNEVLIATNNLSKQYGISFQEASVLIEQGFLNGADSGGDFLDVLKEYPVQFKNAGFSAEEFIKIATQSELGGLYDDKLLDTIKELNLSLSELTKAQTDALRSAFGNDFTKKLSKDIVNNTITVEDAFFRIAKKSKEVGLSVQEQATLTADVFKGAGEDAGGFAKVIGEIEAAYQLNLETLDQYGQLTKDNLDVEKQYAVELNRTAKYLDGLGTSFSNLITTIQTKGLKAFNDIYASFNQAEIRAKENAEKISNYDYSNSSISELELDLELAEKRIKNYTGKIKDLDKTQKELKNGFGASLFNARDIDSNSQALRRNNSVVSESKLEVIALKKAIVAKNKAEQNGTGVTDDANKTTRNKIALTQEEKDALKKANAQRIKDEARLNKERAKSLALLRAKAELEGVGGKDSNAGLQLLEQRAKAKLEAELGFIQLSKTEKATLLESLEQEFVDRRLALKQKNINAEQSQSKQAFDKEIKEQSELSQAIITDIERAYFQEKQLLANKLKEGKISQEQYNNDLERLEQNHQRLILVTAVETINTKIALARAAGQSTIALEKELVIAQIALQNKELANWIKNEETKKGKKIEIDEQEAERKAQREAALQEGITLVNGFFDLQNQSNQDRINTLNEQEKERLNLVKGNAAAEEKIRAEFDKKRAIIKSKQAKNEKKQKIFNVIVNTAGAIARVMEQTGVFAPALIPAFVALGAAQIATIASQKIPKFKKGTEKVGGTGTEDTVHALLTPGERVVPLPINKHLKGIPNADLPKMAAMYKAVNVKEQNNVSTNGNWNDLKNAFENHTTIVMNEKGIYTKYTAQGDEITYLNDRF